MIWMIYARHFASTTSEKGKLIQRASSKSTLDHILITVVALHWWQHEHNQEKNIFSDAICKDSFRWKFDSLRKASLYNVGLPYFSYSYMPSIVIYSLCQRPAFRAHSRTYIFAYAHFGASFVLFLYCGDWILCAWLAEIQRPNGYTSANLSQRGHTHAYTTEIAR